MNEDDSKRKKRTKCEIYSRVVGYLRPVSQWNEGKQEEFKDRKPFVIGGGKYESRKKDSEGDGKNEEI